MKLLIDTNVILDMIFGRRGCEASMELFKKLGKDGSGAYTVTIPRRADATEEQARNRIMPPIPWEATLRGGVHGVKVTGVLTVSLTGSVS